MATSARTLQALARETTTLVGLARDGVDEVQRAKPDQVYLHASRQSFDDAVLAGRYDAVVDGALAQVGTLLHRLTNGVWQVAGGALDGDLTLNIPSDFATLQEAVDTYAAVHPAGHEIVLNIEDGHMPESGISVGAGDFSHFRVTSPARATAALYLSGEITVVAGERITQAQAGIDASGTVINGGDTQVLLLADVTGVFQDAGELSGDQSGAFGAASSTRIARANVVPVPNFDGDFIHAIGGRMPRLDCLIAANGKNTLRHGYFAEDGASGHVTPESGVVGAWGTGCYVHGAGDVHAQDTVWDFCGQGMLYASGLHAWGGRIMGQSASARWSGYYGAQGSHGGNLNFRHGDARHAWRHGIRGSDAGIVDADGATAHGCGRDGSGSNVRSYQGSRVNFADGAADGGYNAFGCFGGDLNIRGASGTGSVASDLIVDGGVVCTSATTDVAATDLTDGLILGPGGGGYSTGKYTPTVTTVANVSAVTAYEASFERRGNIVTVRGYLTVTPGVADASTRLRLALPVPSAMFTYRNLVGSAVATSNQDDQVQPGSVTADATADEALVSVQANSADATLFAYQFTYDVI